jgi:hypothetical protein
MRPQIQPIFYDSLAREAEDDLGWNDMGDDHQHSAEVVPIQPDTAIVQPPAVPEVVRRRDDAARRVAARERRSALAEGRRAAFTLRVDGERHLKLRLACTIRNRSAQQLVTEALDRLLDELPDLASLAAEVARKR